MNQKILFFLGILLLFQSPLFSETNYQGELASVSIEISNLEKNPQSTRSIGDLYAKKSRLQFITGDCEGSFASMKQAARLGEKDSWYTRQWEKYASAISKYLNHPETARSRIELAKEYWLVNERYRSIHFLEGGVFFLQDTLASFPQMLNSERGEIFDSLHFTFCILKEFDKANRIVETLQNDFFKYPEACCAVLLRAGNKFFEDKDLESAEKCFKKISKDLKNTSNWGRGQYNLGLTLMAMGNIPEAIKAFDSILNSGVNDSDPGSNLMALTMNYRSEACKQLSLCYENSNNNLIAIKFERLAMGYYPLGGCGNCSVHFFQSCQNRIKSLDEKFNRQEKYSLWETVILILRMTEFGQKAYNFWLNYLWTF